MRSRIRFENQRLAVTGVRGERPSLERCGPRPGPGDGDYVTKVITTELCEL